MIVKFPFLQVEYQIRIEVLPVYPYFKMKVFRRSSSCASGQCNRLSGFYIVSRLDQIFGVMAIDCFQSVVMAYNNYVSVCIIRLS